MHKVIGSRGWYQNYENPVLHGPVIISKNELVRIHILLSLYFDLHNQSKIIKHKLQRKEKEGGRDGVRSRSSGWVEFNGIAAVTVKMAVSVKH